MENGQLRCIVCERSSQEVPVIRFEFKGQQHGICPTHLPILIHKPANLADKLPGIESMAPAEGHSH